MTNPFINPRIRDWWLSGVNLEQTIPSAVTTGSGPFAENEFDNFLEQLGVFVSVPDKESDIMIVGRENCDSEVIDKQIDLRRGQRLRVYSQEMIIAYAARGVDPFSDLQVLLEFGLGHPILEELARRGFIWMIPQVPDKPSEGPPPVIGYERGVLKYMGYEVGKNGKSPHQRRQILQKIMSEHLPNIENPNYMAEWSTPNSCERLKKIAHSITAFVNLGRRRRPSPVHAIRDWEEDLEWLKGTYYSGRCRFVWPATQVF